MMRLNLFGNADGRLRVLCLGAHSDDIEIGCGGTILRLAAEHPNVEFHWAVFTAAGLRETEALNASSLFAGKALKTPILKAFRDGYMPFDGVQVKDVFERELKPLAPDLIFTHSRKDAHQDHRLLAELTWNTFRNHFILEYEIPKYDGDLGQPQFFVPLSTEQAQQKSRILMEVFGSQRSKHWFSEETFLGLMRLRGMECNAPSGYAEGFYCRKLAI